MWLQDLTVFCNFFVIFFFLCNKACVSFLDLCSSSEILETTLELLGEFSNGLPSTPCFGRKVQLCHPPSGWEASEGH